MKVNASLKRNRKSSNNILLFDPYNLYILLARISFGGHYLSLKAALEVDLYLLFNTESSFPFPFGSFRSGV